MLKCSRQSASQVLGNLPADPCISIAVSGKDSCQEDNGLVTLSFQFSYLLCTPLSALTAYYLHCCDVSVLTGTGMAVIRCGLNIGLHSSQLHSSDLPLHTHAYHAVDGPSGKDSYVLNWPWHMHVNMNVARYDSCFQTGYCCSHLQHWSPSGLEA